ncbi:MAG: hypothetical protein SFU86_07200 [Pirellulaceae bacterium]|nr:hypothetical protein [Pirellulaceae bacterium]
MNVTFRCPHCDQISRADFEAGSREVACPHCATAWPLPDQAVSADKLHRCLICPSTELFIRKDFSQRLGVAIVVVGFIISSIFWYYRMPLWTYAVLFATALIDVVLYVVVGNVLHCYRCQAQYRGVPGLENHAAFDLETHEKHRQQLIRLGQQSAPQGPAG